MLRRSFFVMLPALFVAKFWPRQPRVLPEKLLLDAHERLWLYGEGALTVPWESAWEGAFEAQDRINQARSLTLDTLSIRARR